MLPEPVWLTWHDHPRSRSLARLLGAELCVYSRRMDGVFRHWEGFWWTVSQLARRRPRVIYLQNSFLLLLVCAWYRKLCGRKVQAIVADCHNKSLKRRCGGSLASVFWRLKTFSFQAVDLIVVSNSALFPEARRLCDNVVSLIDPLPSCSDPQRWPASVPPDRRFVLFVCSYEPDEPLALLADAIERLHSSTCLTFVLTGTPPPGSPIAELGPLERVVLPGYVAWKEYLSLMYAAELVVVLTEDDDCLCCGGYEAVSCGRPLLLAEHPLLQEVFGSAATYTLLDAEALCDSIVASVDAPNPQVANGEAREILTRRQDEELRELRNRLEQVVAAAGKV